MVLNRFLAGSEVELLGTTRVEEGGARVNLALAIVEAVFDLALLVVVLSASFIGLDETGLLADGIFSVLGVELRVDLRSRTKGVVLPSTDLLVLAGLSETLLLGAADNGFLFSDSDPVPALLPSSRELTDRRDLCSTAAVGAVVFEAIGFADLAVTGGRVGGLLRPPAEMGFLLLGAEDEDGAAVAIERRDVVNGRFGGATAFLVGFVRVSSASDAFAFSLEGRATSSPDNDPGSFSTEEASTDAAGPVEAMEE